MNLPPKKTMLHTIWPFRPKKLLPILALTAAIPLAVTIAPTIDIGLIRINLFQGWFVQNSKTEIEQPQNVVTTPPTDPNFPEPVLPNIPQPSSTPVVNLPNSDDALEQLQHYVASALYPEAHTLTRDLLTKAVGQPSGYIKSVDLEKSPQACKALVDIDRAWDQGSGSRYSFSKQLQIRNKKAQARNGWNKYQDFMILVAWAHPDKGILPPNYSGNAPDGHLPYWDGSFKEPGDTSFDLFRILENCKNNPLL